MSAGPQKKCPFCAEEISAAAKLCPRCRRWLTWCSLRHPFLFMGAHFLLYVLLAFWIVAMLKHFFNPTPYYTEYRNSLQVLESRMNWVQKEQGFSIYVTGILTNQSAIAWKGIELECRFYDTNGVMIDAANAYAHATVQPNDDSAFRASVIPTRPTNDYASFKLSVSTARNTKSLF
jgi:hypothetical protein